MSHVNLVRIMRVRDVDKKGCILEYDGRVYFIDKKDSNSNKYAIGNYVPVVIVKELDKYGFVVTAESLSELYIDILKQPVMELGVLYKVVLNKEGYIININNIIDNNHIVVDDIEVNPTLTNLLGMIYKNSDKSITNSVYGTSDTRTMFNKFSDTIKLLYVIDKHYSELVKYKNT